jgi:Leucine-rich repeat (LRR) protein
MTAIIIFLLNFAAFSSAIQNSTPQVCPSKCECIARNDTREFIVSCTEGGMTNKHLLTIIQSMPSYVTQIYIDAPLSAQNSFSFTTDFARFDQLQSLTLRNCGITGLGKASLSGMKQLKTLNLARNNIDYLSVATFDGANSIEVLDLSHNLLGRKNYKLPTGAFAHLTKLKQLSLAYNDLTVIPVDIFGRSYTLAYLDISGNRIDSTVSEHNKR